MQFIPIVGTLVYLWDRTRDVVLLIRRDARLDDDHYGKVNGLGGKLEVDEDLVSGAEREVMEEAGVQVGDLTLRGTITFSGFGAKRQQWLVALFVATEWHGEMMTANDEGNLEWVDRAELLAACKGDPAASASLPMWAGDRYFLPLVFDEDPRVFFATMPYDRDTPLSWSFRRA